MSRALPWAADGDFRSPSPATAFVLSPAATASAHYPSRKPCSQDREPKLKAARTPAGAGWVGLAAAVSVSLSSRSGRRCARAPGVSLAATKVSTPVSLTQRLRNVLFMVVAEIPGPWPRWRSERRAAVMRDLDILNAAWAASQAPLQTVEEERLAAKEGRFTKTEARFPHINNKVRPAVSLQNLPVVEKRRLVIVGAGPSGYTAAMYAARARLRPLLFCGPLVGGQLMLTSDVENFPGYPEAVSGPQMMTDMRTQCERFGAEIREKLVEAVDLSDRPFRIKIQGEEGVVEADSMIIATGATARWLGAEEEDAVKGIGVSTCAVCDGALFADEEVAVIGGGDTAIEDALFLARFASHVTLLHRSEKFRASALMLERCKREPKVTMKTWRNVKSWKHDESGLTGIELGDPRDPNFRETLNVTGAFIAIGHDAQSKLFKNQLAMDEDGYILHTRPGASTMTSIPGVFSSGDVSDRRYRQAITAAGHGCQAALDCERWLDKVPEVGY
eukprot:CAMPEP_0170592138 /NCGR_PEP_ID=MMETSP0224-20130122/12771_1 /TAXON_ID=285029 /ORGANISM="Togula jolla, Strain CCCM 725" /LENGTH=502 /DNA_ID=CAMNT_0010916037 /DNA_START=32 /DNA_END=1540 /DNA_ORIENTATION=-